LKRSFDNIGNAGGNGGPSGGPQAKKISTKSDKTQMDKTDKTVTATKASVIIPAKTNSKMDAIVEDYLDASVDFNDLFSEPSAIFQTKKQSEY